MASSEKNENKNKLKMNSQIPAEESGGGSLSKDKITEILNKRHKKRQQDLDSVHEQKNKDVDETEGRDYFDQIFDTKTREIKNNLNNLLQLNGDKAELGLAFNSIVQAIQELQRYLSSSTLFLTDYKIKMCQNVINELHAKCEEEKQKLIPKKKFGFKSKKVEVVAPVVVVEEQPVVVHRVKQQQEFEWTVSNRSNEWIRLVTPEQVNDQDLTFSNLTNCIVEIQGHAGSVQMSHMKNCIVLTGPVARSIFADHCTDCRFAFACQQLRLHSSSACDIYLHVTCRGIIEDCREIRVAPYNYRYEGQSQDFVDTRSLDESVNRWQDIADFNWLSPDVHSPNWREFREDEERDGGDEVGGWQQRLEEFKGEFSVKKGI